MVANLAPRKMKFGVSEGMILSAGTGGSDLFLLSADSGVTVGYASKIIYYLGDLGRLFYCQIELNTLPYRSAIYHAN